MLWLAVLCEDVVYDADGQPYALNVPVHTLQWPAGAGPRYQPPTLSVYLQLEDALGTFFVRAVLRAAGDTTEVYRTPAAAVAFDGTTNRVVPLELVLWLDGMAFPAPGAYELAIFANHADLHGPNPRTPIPFPPIRVTVLSAAPTPPRGAP